MAQGPRSLSLVWRLLIGINLGLVAILGLFALWDYRTTSRALLIEKKTALEEEAQILLTGLERMQGQTLSVKQAYIDEVCGQMQDATSPGHHVAARIGHEVIQAHAHHRASPARPPHPRRPNGGATVAPPAYRQRPSPLRPCPRPRPTQPMVSYSHASQTSFPP